ncbi:MAG: 2-amino-4-hydroxy-6-hydroxymethyldihydropteridine diphosphokinase [Cellvibrionaceae bacterium]
MSTHSTAFIGLGSNLDSPSQQISRGLDLLTEIEGCKNLLCAKWYSSKAIGPGEQPDYVNTVAKLETKLSPHALLKQLHIIENQRGRQREVRWGARTLDLDLLLYDNIQLEDEILSVPHPEIQHRAFVLLPLYDLAPSLVLPTGEVLQDLIKRCDTNDLRVIEEPVINI